MIDYKKWTNSLPSSRNNLEKKSINQLDPDIWVNTIPKKNVFRPIRKFSVTVILFVFGLIIVSAVKNETRNLEKQINNLKASINSLYSDLSQAKLDYEVLTSPENVSLLATEYLSDDFVYYKKSQIKRLYKESYVNKNTEKEKKNLKVDIKNKIVAKIETKKKEIKKLQIIYSNPKKAPTEIKKQISKKVEKKRNEIKDAYNSPKEILASTKVQKWAAVQVVKAFLGIPIVPGK